MLNRKHYYFATHLTDESIKTRLRVGAEFQRLKAEEKDLLDKLHQNYKIRDKNTTVLDYCGEFIKNHQSGLKNLESIKGFRLKYFLREYLGFKECWGSSTKSYGKPYGGESHKFAEEISESELITEMTDPKGTIKELLDSAGGDRKTVKPFLPAIIISLNTKTRDKDIMVYRHTGKFMFDFDKIGDEQTTLQLMNKLWKGTKNIKPYMSFVSPSGNGFKLFCQVDISSKEFQEDFGNMERNSVINHHKMWYSGALVQLKTQFPEIIGIVDEGTNDPTRLTYIPYISEKATHFKYDSTVFSNYDTIIYIEKKKRTEQLKNNINKNKIAIKKIMDENGIQSEKDAYHIFLRNKSTGFDIEFELNKFQKVVKYMLIESKNNSSLKEWMKNTFSSYELLVILSWVMYGVFGDVAIEEIKKLIPEGSNKLDSTHGDYRWALCNDDNYTEEQRTTLTPSYFYSLVFQREEVKNYTLRSFPLDSTKVSEFNRLHSYYDNYQFDLTLGEDKDNESEFLSNLSFYMNTKKNRLPLINQLEETLAEIALGPNDYLDKNVMEDLFQKKYADKKVFLLRSQCGKN